MTRDEALQKAAKLLRLAQSDNVHEAAQAAARAQEILTRFDLDAAMLDESEESPEEELEDIIDFGPKGAPLDRSGRVATWRLSLAGTIAKANSSFVYYYPGSGIQIIGRPSDVQRVRYLYALIVKQVDAMTKREGVGCGRVWNNNFRLGMVSAISKRLRKTRDDLEQQLRTQAHSPHALMRIDKAIAKVKARSEAVAAWVGENKSFGSGVASHHRHDSNAHTAGRAAGAKVVINSARGALKQ